MRRLAFVLTVALAVSISLWPTPAFGQSAPALLADIGDQHTPRQLLGAPVANFVEMGGLLYFLGDDGVHGQELWVTDGTPSGTRLVRDICPGYCWSRWNSELVVMNEVLYFTASDGIHNRELWRSDGTRDGTWMVADLAELRWSDPQWLTVVGDRLFFAARADRQVGQELFVSDGTTAGTRKLSPTGAGLGPLSEPSHLVALGDRLFFVASDPAHGREPWVSDGTDAGTVLVDDLVAGPEGSSLRYAGSLGRRRAVLVHRGQVLFATIDALWVSDGTKAGTARIDLGSPAQFVGSFFVFAGEVYFQARTAGLGAELWVSDGTQAGTELVADIEPGEMSSWADPLAVLGDRLYLAATTEGLGRELWRTAGRGSGAELVRDLNPGPASGMYWSSNSGALPCTSGDQFLFFGQDGVSGGEPWITDGTSEGTKALGDLDPGPNSSAPYGADFGCAFLDSYWIFQATDPTLGREYFRSDGTAPGTQLLVDLDFQTSSLRQSYSLMFGASVAAQGRIFFEAQDSAHGNELWVSDGTAQGTHLVMDLFPGAESGVGAYSGLTAKLWFHDELYFAASDGVRGQELWATDGSEAGTRLVQDLEPGPIDSYPQDFVLYQDRLAFATSNAVWATDGKSAPVQLAVGFLPLGLTPAEELLYFMADCQVQVYDADAGSVVRLAVPDLAVPDTPVPTLGVSFCPHSLTLADAGRQVDVAGGRRSDHLRLFFVNETSAEGGELWVYDRLAGGSRMVRDIYPGEATSMRLDSEPDEPDEALIARLDSRVLLLADDGAHGTELWLSDGSEAGTVLLKDVNPGPASSRPRFLTPAPGGAYFVASDGSHGRELWWSDGTAAGTRMVADLAPGGDNSMPRWLTVVGDELYFSATDGHSGVELWRYRPGSPGPARVADLNPGSGASTPRLLTPFDNGLFFFATDGELGFEPWMLRLERGQGESGLMRSLPR